MIYKELYNAEVLILKSLVLMPLIDEIKITISKPSPLNINPKLVIVTQPVSIIN